MRKIDEYLRNTEPELVDLLVAFVIVTSGIMLLQLVLGIFEPVSALFLSLLICGAIGLAFVRKIVLPGDSRNIAAIVLMGVLVLMPRWSPFLYVEGGQDEGIYVSMSSYFARSQGLTIKDSIRVNLSDSQKIEYDKNNHSYIVPLIAHRYEGLHQPGIYISDLSQSSYIFQFYPLHPLWMAMAGKILGEQFRVYSLVVFSLLNVLMLSLLVCELSGRKREPAFMAAILLAINPMHVFFSRFPVTENVTVFFSASAIYYLVRYFRSREQNNEKFGHLLLSAGAWGCMFFNHISGFMYAPILLLVLLAGVVTADSASRLRHMAGYGILVFGAYWLSLWYGMTWSFPYSYDVYRSLFGTGIGHFFIRHWHAVSLFYLTVGAGLTYFTWFTRVQIKSVWSRLSLDHGVIWLLMVVLFCTVISGIYEGYRLGFTDDYSRDNYLKNIYHLCNTGFIGFVHSSLISLAVYVSPFLMLFVLAMIAQKRYNMKIYEIFLVMLVTLFLVLRTGIESFTYYYYYGRYLCSELLPYIIVLAALWMHYLWEQNKRHCRVIVVGLFGLSVIWQAAALAQQYPGGEKHRLDASLKPLIQRINDDDVLILSGINSPAFRTGLDYYYGKHTVYVEPEATRNAARQYLSSGSDVYVLSYSYKLAGFTYLGMVSPVDDTYRRGILPMYPVTLTKERLYLYLANWPQLSSLYPGDRISLVTGGDTSPYLGLGWTGMDNGMRWTEGESASLELPIAETSSDLTLRFDLAAFNCVDVSVRVNDTVRTHWSFAGCRGYEERTVTLNREDMKSGKVNISFDMPGVKSPHDLNPSLRDTRKLGISVRSFVIDRSNSG